MYEQLQVSHGLYSIKASHLQQFQQIAKNYQFEKDTLTAMSLNTLDNHAVVLNIWCMFKEQDLNISFLVEKMMAYACNYFCLGLLQNNVKIKQFTKGRKMNDDTYFVLSYYLADATLNWVSELMKEHEEGLKFFEINQERQYFLYAEQEDLTLDANHHFFETQKFITHILASDSAQTNRFVNYVDEALSLTKNYLSKNPAFTV